MRKTKQFEREAAMKTCFLAVVLAMTAAGLFLLVLPAVAQGTPLHLFVSNGLRAIIDDLRPQIERTVGHPLEIQSDTTVGLKRRIEAGEAFDAAILTSDAIDDLVKRGKLATSARVDLARAGIGVGVRKGAAKPDIRTAEAFKRALQNAKAITYASEGASRVYIEKMFENFGIATEMKAKTTMTPSSITSKELVLEGKADLVLTLVSEILPEPGVELVGPFPAEVQSFINYSGSISANAANAEAGKALIQFLKGPAAAPIYRAKGMEPR
jgi:molybdate transport system substrate-binding protein